MKRDMTSVIGWGVTVVIFIAGSWITQSRAVDSKIDMAKSESYQANVEVVQRVATIEETQRNQEKKLDELGRDVKEILKILK